MITKRRDGMKKRVLNTLCLLGLSGLAGNAAAEGWRAMPVLDDGWSPNITLAATYGIMTFDSTALDDDDAYGVQLSLDCPWFGPPEGSIRQQFNYNVYDDGGVEISSFELNPRFYFLPPESNFNFGIGPGVGYVWTDTTTTDDENWSLQVGADLEYRYSALFIGLSSRYQEVNDSGADNTFTSLKFGVNF